MRFVDHDFNKYCECKYCDLRSTLKYILETIKVYSCDEARKKTYEMMLKHYRTKLSNGYTPPANVPHYFITISLPVKENFAEEETLIVEQLSQIKYLSDALGIFEYHGTDLKYHPHVHIITHMKMMNKTNLVKAFANKLNIAKNFIDVKYATSPDLYKTRCDYIAGIKRDEKQELLDADVAFREKHSLINSFKLKDKNITIL